MQNNIRLGWIGVRGYGERFWKTIKESASCNVVACLHPDKKVAREASQRMHCHSIFTDIDEFFACQDMNAVILTVPNEYHFMHAKKALEAGKHVLVEKPLTNSLEEARILKKLAENKSLVLMVGHNYRKSSFLVKMKQKIENGRIGKPVAAELNMGHGGGLKFGPERWRFHREKCPGGPLNMLGTHLIDASNYLFGNVKNVKGTVKNLYADTSAEDMSLIQLEYESGVVSNITTLYNSVSTEFINIYGTEGALRYSRWPEAGLWIQPKDIDCDCAQYEKIAFKNNNTTLEIFEDFVNVIQGPRRDLLNIDAAVETVRIMEEALKLQNVISR